MNHFINLPPTKASAMLNLSDEIADMHRIVYETTDDGEGYVFSGIYDPEIEYRDNSIIVPLNSVFLKTDNWLQGTEFANVLGSSNDKGHYHGKSKSWKEIYQALKLPWMPYEDGKFYDSVYDYELTDPEFTCSIGPNDPYGGHVVKGTTPKRLPAGINVEVYIVPICHSHNSKCVNHSSATPGQGNGFYMKMKNSQKVVLMTSYLSEEEVAKYL